MILPKIVVWWTKVVNKIIFIQHQVLLALLLSIHDVDFDYKRTLTHMKNKNLQLW